MLVGTSDPATHSKQISQTHIDTVLNVVFVSGVGSIKSTNCSWQLKYSTSKRHWVESCFKLWQLSTDAEGLKSYSFLFGLPSVTCNLSCYCFCAVSLIDEHDWDSMLYVCEIDKKYVAGGTIWQPLCNKVWISINELHHMDHSLVPPSHMEFIQKVSYRTSRGMSGTRPFFLNSTLKFVVPKISGPSAFQFLKIYILDLPSLLSTCILMNQPYTMFKVKLMKYNWLVIANRY